eukprot:324592_1
MSVQKETNINDDIISKYRQLEPGRKQTLITSSQSDHEMFKSVAKLCGFTDDKNTLDQLQEIINGGVELQSKKNDNSNQMDWGTSTHPPHGTPGKIKTYWPKGKDPSIKVQQSRRYYGALLSECKWGKKQDDKMYFVARVKQFKDARKEYIQSKIKFYKSPCIVAAHDLDIEVLKEQLMEQKSNKKKK